MKKFAKIMALSLVVVMAIAVLAACGGSWSNNPAEAKKQAEDKGYTVTSFYDYSDDPDVDGQIGVLVAKKSGSSSTTEIYIQFFDSVEHAKAALESQQDALDAEAALLKLAGGKMTYKVEGTKLVVQQTRKGLSAIFG